MNLWNPCRKDHPAAKLVDGLMTNPLDDFEFHAGPDIRKEFANFWNLTGWDESSAIDEPVQLLLPLYV